MFILPNYVEHLRIDVRKLRVYNQVLQKANSAQKENVEKLKEKLERVEKERDKLKIENEKLKIEIEKLTKTKNRYQISLFDHGNFKHPDEKERKQKGGQTGHKDTNRERQEDISVYLRKRVFANQCGNCGGELTRVNAIKEKLLLDIVINPQAVRLLLEVERQWCTTCKKEVLAKNPQSLPFTEYGMNIFMMVLFLRFRCLLPLSKVGAVTELLGLCLSESVVNNILVQAKEYLGSYYEKLLTAVRKGEIMYNDETGWMVRGKSAWLWVAANEEVTVYKAAESRGKGIFESIYGNSDAYSMHDGYACYEGITGEEKSLYCWSHILRFSFEETALDPPDSEGVHLREGLVALYRKKQKDPTVSEKEIRDDMDHLLSIISNQQSVKAIHHRLIVQKEGLIKALFLTLDGTNNRSEQELRSMAIMRYTSSGSDTYKGMETTAVLASVVRTQLKKPLAQFSPDMKFHLLTGIKQSSWQYRHRAVTENHPSETPE